MRFSARLLFALVLPAWPALATEAALDPANAWFKPTLVENRSPLCSAVLAQADRLFYSTLPQLDNRPIIIAGMHAIDPEQDLPQEHIVLPHPNTGAPLQGTQAFVTTHGRKMYVSRRTNPGCGSACETRQMFASLQPFQAPMRYEKPAGLSQPTPAAPELTLLKAPDDLYYVAVVDSGQLQLYALSEDAAWDGICKVDMRPKDLHSSSHAELQATVKSIFELRSTIGLLRQQAGSNCGSLRAHDRGTERLNDALDRALYRPWTLQASGPQAPGAPGDPLSEWSVIGIEEYAAMEKYRAQLPVTIGQLARFYAHGFGWPDATAAIAAEKAVAAALHRGFGFSGIPLFADRSAAVRLAILEHRPVGELEALNWQPAPQGETWTEQESVLNVAVHHPAALRWLLSQQLDPNQGNAFGKTPLMYAAQHDALEAVEILLAHGADPNAATVFPEDTCTYTLTRANVTALHYAVRFGSLEIVQALLDGGALPSVKTIVAWDEEPGQTPLEWLDRYASPNIAAADRPRLRQLLSERRSTAIPEDPRR